MWLSRRLLTEFRLRRSDRVVKRLAGFAKAAVAAYENASYDLASNGELHLLKCVGALQPRVIFDVGANVGDWARAARQVCRTASVHCFEIVPDTFSSLSRSIVDDSMVRLNNFGLASLDGEIPVVTHQGASELASIVSFPHSRETATVMCPVRTGDGYLRDANVERVDLLKIDVEGAEWEVLQGFRDALRQQRIRLIQFEYGQINIVTHRLLLDYYAFFRDLGYVVGKLYPRGVEFRDYSFDHEDFIGPNFVAAPADDLELLQAVSV